MEYCEAAADAVAKLEEILQQIPKFVLVITGESPEEYFSTITTAYVPWILAGQGGPVISLGRSRGVITCSTLTTASLVSVCPPSPLITRVSLRSSKPVLSCPRIPRQLRVAYNNESLPYFDLKEGQADVSTLEGAVLQLFLDKYQISPVYMYGNYEWGSLDPETGLWNGVVGMVGYGESDLGVSIISYTQERNSFIDYSPAVGTDSMVWVTKGGEEEIKCQHEIFYFSLFHPLLPPLSAP